MTEEDWEQLESDILELLSDVGITNVLDDVETLTLKFVSVLRRQYKESNTDDDGND